MKVAASPAAVVMPLIFVLGTGCLARAPAHPEAQRLNLEAARRLQQGDLESAATHLAVSLEYNPCYAEALHNLALVELSRGRLELAEKHELEALECRPEFVQAVNGLGVVYWKQGRDEIALDTFAKALELDPGCVDARRNLVLAAVEMGRCGLARIHLERLELLVDEHEWEKTWRYVRCGRGDEGASSLAAGERSR